MKNKIITHEKMEKLTELLYPYWKDIENPDEHINKLRNNESEMKISKPRTEHYHLYEEGNCGKPINRDGSNTFYFKKGFWKRYDRKKFLRNVFKYFYNQ